MIKITICGNDVNFALQQFPEYHACAGEVKVLHGHALAAHLEDRHLLVRRERLEHEVELGAAQARGQGEGVAVGAGGGACVGLAGVWEPGPGLCLRA